MLSPFLRIISLPGDDEDGSRSALVLGYKAAQSTAQEEKKKNSYLRKTIKPWLRVLLRILFGYKLCTGGGMKPLNAHLGNNKTGNLQQGATGCKSWASFISFKISTCEPPAVPRRGNEFLYLDNVIVGWRFTTLKSLQENIFFVRAVITDCC